MSAAESGTALSSDGVDLIDEHYARAVALGLLKQIPDSGCADTDIKFHEIGSRYGEERASRFPRDGSGKQGLSGPGRSYKQYSARDLCAEFVVFRGILEEIDDLLKLLLLLIRAGYFVKCYLSAFVLALHSGFAYVVDPASALLGHGDIEHYEHHHRDEHRQPVHEDIKPGSRLDVVVLHGHCVHRVVLRDVILGIVDEQIYARDLVSLEVCLAADLVGQESGSEIQRELRDLLFLEQLDDLGIERSGRISALVQIQQ